MANQDWRTVRRLLVARLDNIGDVVMCGPALRALRAGVPNAKITLWASPGGSAAATFLPEVDDVLPTKAIWQDLGHMPFDPDRERGLIDDIARGGFDALVVFTSFSQTPYPPAYVGYLAGIPLRAGQSREFGGAVLTDWIKPLPDAVHQVDRNLHLVEQLGFAPAGHDLHVRVDSVARRSLVAKLADVGVREGERFILVHPGASCPSRMYPWQRFAMAAHRLHQQTGLPVIVSGGPREVEVAEQLCAVEPSFRSLAGRTTLPELGALVEGAALMLANNTSVMHLADALNVPSVVMFAGTELEEQWRPRRTRAILLRRPTHCQPCYAFTCRYQHECLDIPADEVAAAALQLLDSALAQGGLAHAS